MFVCFYIVFFWDIINNKDNEFILRLNSFLVNYFYNDIFYFVDIRDEVNYIKLVNVRLNSLYSYFICKKKNFLLNLMINENIDYFNKRGKWL